MVKYLLKFFIIICIILPFYLKVRKPWQKDTEREFVLAVFILFMTGLMALALQGEYHMPSRMLTLARSRIAAGNGINLVPFRSIRSYFVHYGLDGFLVNFVGNIVMFMPWGLGLTLLWKKNQKFWIVVLYSLGLTVLIESVQLCIGRSVDVDDLILNFSGSLLGAGVSSVLRKKYRKLSEWAR